MPDFKIPLAGSYNTRVAATNVLSSSSGVVGVGIIGLMIVGLTGTTTTKDQRFVNCFTERVSNPFIGKTTVYLVKRPGFASSSTPEAGSIGNAILVWTGSSGKVMSCFGATNSTLYDGTTGKGAITGKARGLTETFVGASVATVAISSSDSTGWYYDVATGAATKITDADFPGNASLTTVGNFAHMAGFSFIMDTKAQIWNSDVNSLTAWTASAFITASSYPDVGIGVVRKGDKIMAFGTESVQFFYNAGLAPAPLLPIEPMTIRVGAISADAITEIGDTVFWAGSSPQGGVGIYQYGTGAQRISTPEIDSILLLSGAGNISLSAAKFYGRSFVIVQAGSVTFVYCIEEKAWHEWASTTPLWYKCAGVSTGSSQVTYAISKNSTSGKVFTINPASLTFQDNGAAFSAIWQTSLLGEGNKRTFWDEVEIIGDRQTSASAMTISYSDDDYQTYTTLGTVDLSDARPRLTRCGSAYRRAWVGTHSANTPMRIEALAGRKTVGTA